MSACAMGSELVSRHYSGESVDLRLLIELSRMGEISRISD